MLSNLLFGSKSDDHYKVFNCGTDYNSIARFVKGKKKNSAFLLTNVYILCILCIYSMYEVYT